MRHYLNQSGMTNMHYKKSYLLGRLISVPKSHFSFTNTFRDGFGNGLQQPHQGGVPKEIITDIAVPKGL